MNRRKRDTGKKERAIMLASAVFVLAALTLTGVYVNESSIEEKDDGYIIDFAKLEEESKEETKIAKVEIEEETEEKEQIEGELDYSPMLEEVGSGVVEIPGVTLDEEPKTKGADEQDVANALEETESTSSQNVTIIQENLDFQEGDTLVWPIVGNVLINFSMDKTVYFPTLEQYKYNPGIVIEAVESDMITAAANGKVMEVYADDELGNVVKMDIGNGYEVLYGQLKDIQVSEGTYVEAGDLVGYVASPTKYYSVEGCNVYFALYKDGVAINPMSCLGAEN